MNHETPNTPPVKLPNTLTHQLYALVVLYLYRLPLDRSGGNERMRMESAVRCGCMQKRAMEIPFRVLAVVLLVLHSQRRPWELHRCVLALSLSLCCLLNPALDDVTAARAGLPRASTVRDSKPKGNIQDSYALST